mmetsp:Transcript_10492/g.21803  ORF Transcript_10492/g.21803 Transcript_10492/m.21803 type:complete len:150 (+) Transcript_10492:49-498(+)
MNYGCNRVLEYVSSKSLFSPAGPSAILRTLMGCGAAHFRMISLAMYTRTQTKTCPPSSKNDFSFHSYRRNTSQRIATKTGHRQMIKSIKSNLYKRSFGISSPPSSFTKSKLLTVHVHRYLRIDVSQAAQQDNHRSPAAFELAVSCTPET